ncbi:hypothetical protein MRB53_034797 [Persea americana]|uniref:Uncharacterized protein n=1 Tax=Persea americana TaxID=3435 RepID=A0ACC2K2W7_PERAE|nr:hypothetical protein MRB53_034797 [Persea americana]
MPHLVLKNMQASSCWHVVEYGGKQGIGKVLELQLARDKVKVSWKRGLGGAGRKGGVVYASSATPADFDIYAPDASFEDPFMSARGVKEIKTAFYSLPKVFSESRIVEYNVRENVINPGTGEILIDNKQYYKIFGKNLFLTSLIKLYIEDGRVVRHEDWWGKKPLWNRNTVKPPALARPIR